MLDRARAPTPAIDGLFGIVASGEMGRLAWNPRRIRRQIGNCPPQPLTTAAPSYSVIAPKYQTRAYLENNIVDRIGRFAGRDT
jgi:hypothetical protein